MADSTELVLSGLQKSSDSNTSTSNVEPLKGTGVERKTSKHPKPLGPDPCYRVASKTQIEDGNGRSVERRTSSINRSRVDKRSALTDKIIGGCKSTLGIECDTNTSDHASNGLRSGEVSDTDNDESCQDEESGSEEDESCEEEESGVDEEDEDIGGKDENLFEKSVCECADKKNIGKGECFQDEDGQSHKQDSKDNDSAVLCARSRPPCGFYNESEESKKLREDSPEELNDKISKGKKIKRKSSITSTADSKTDDKTDDREYEIFNILAKREKKNGKFQYLPEWIPNHWVNEEDMNADELLSEYNSKEQVQIRENVWAPIDHNFIVEPKELPNSGEQSLAILPAAQPVANSPATDWTDFLASIQHGFNKIQMTPEELGFVRTWPVGLRPSSSWPGGLGTNVSWPGGLGTNVSWPGGLGMNVSWPGGLGMNGSWPGGLGQIGTWPSGFGSVPSTGFNTLALLPGPSTNVPIVSAQQTPAQISYLPVQTTMGFNIDGTPRIKCTEPGCTSTFLSYNSMKKHRRGHRNSK